MAPIERARPLLGTIVALRIEGLATWDAHRLADAAFAEIKVIHDLMSFQQTDSELNRINRDGSRAAIALHPHTRACLAHALDLAGQSAGAFDPVRGGGSWRDIVLDDDEVRTTAPLTIDLSGIAKGYAVDRACDILCGSGASAGLVNAGGDLRVFGAVEETIVLRPVDCAEPAVLCLADGAVASSDPARDVSDRGVPQHFDGRDGRVVDDRFVTVCAPTCIDADALTKIVLALGHGAMALLRARSAMAHVYEADGWRTIGVGTGDGEP